MSSTYTVTIEELKSLINGNFDFRSCIDCMGSGVVAVDTHNGCIAHSASDPEDIEMEGCYQCNGLGGTLKINLG